MPVSQITELSHLNSLISENPKVVIDFTASWCGPCKIIGPQFVNLSDKHPSWTFLKVDVDEAEEISSTYNISAMPTFVFIKDGAEVSRFSGANVESLTERLNKY